MIIPTLVDPSMAPPGKHVISCFVQYAPYKLAPELGTWDDQREAFGDAVIDRIAEFAPNIRDIILHRNVQTPLDIERTTGLTEGNIFQGELSLEQLFFNRPVPGYARFRTPGPRPVAVRLVDPSRAAGSWAPTGGSRRSRSCARAAGRRPERWRTERLRRDRHRRRPQRPGDGRLPRQGRACGRSSSSAARRVGGAAAHLGAGARARACRRSPTRSGGSGRRSSATSTSSATGCRSSARTCASSRRAWTARRSCCGATPPGRPTASGPVGRRRRSATRRSTGSSARWRGFLGEIAGQTPPDIESPGLGDALAGLRLGRTFRGLGRQDGRTITRVLPMAVADFVAESFETDALRAAIAWRGIQYTAMGPWSAGTTAVLLADSAGNDGGAAGQTVFARGGPGRAGRRARVGGPRRPASRSGPAPRSSAITLGRRPRDRRRPRRRRGARRRGPSSPASTRSGP